MSFKELRSGAIKQTEIALACIVLPRSKLLNNKHTFSSKQDNEILTPHIHYKVFYETGVIAR